MNEYMRRTMGEWALWDREIGSAAVDPEYRRGFRACHDMLMPLLQQAATHVIASQGAEHMLDGFRPQKRPIDGLVEQIKRVTE